MNNSQDNLYNPGSTHRTHDKFYLREDRKESPKEYFKFIANIARDYLSKPGSCVLDVGCATGDFLYFLKGTFKELKLYGMDVDEELLEKARSEVDGVEFIQDDLSIKKNRERYDIVFANGLHSIFDELSWLDNLIDMVKSGGHLYVFGLFNPENIDVLIKSRPSNSNEKWESGWNIFSKATVSGSLKDKNISHVFYDFSLPIDISKNTEDPLRSWTERLDDGNRLIINGLQVVNRLSLLEVSK